MKSHLRTPDGKMLSVSAYFNEVGGINIISDNFQAAYLK